MFDLSWIGQLLPRRRVVARQARTCFRAHPLQRRQERDQLRHLVRVLGEARSVDAQRDDVEVPEQVAVFLRLARERQAIGDDAQVAEAQVLARISRQLDDVLIQQRLAALEPDRKALFPQVLEDLPSLFEGQAPFGEAFRVGLGLVDVAVRAAQVAGAVDPVVAEQRRAVDAGNADGQLGLNVVPGVPPEQSDGISPHHRLPGANASKRAREAQTKATLKGSPYVRTPTARSIRSGRRPSSAPLSSRPVRRPGSAPR